MSRSWLRFLSLVPWSLVAVCYDVAFVGLDDRPCVKALENRSELVRMQERPPASLNGLRFRVDADLPNMIQTLHAFGYYDAWITYEISQEEQPRVTIMIHPGDKFRLTSYQVFHGVCKEPLEIPCWQPPESKEPLSVRIVNTELDLLTQLSRTGYPLAYVDKRRVEVDLQTKEVHGSVCVEEGPYSKFGPTYFMGLKTIHPRYIERRITWREGEEYDSDLIEETQRQILKTDLFSSVLISHGDAIDAKGELPIQMRLTEAKHRQVNVGVYYATEDGPGGSFGWTHRNLRGMGEVFNAEVEFSVRFWEGRVAYKKPDFLTVDQTYQAYAEATRENIHPYLAYSYGGGNLVERKIDSKRTFSTEFKVEYVNVLDSASNGAYLLAGLPLFYKYDTSNSPLDPTHGMTITYSIAPYQSLFHQEQRFAKQWLNSTFYIPLIPSKKVVLALRAQAGSIAGASRKNVPLPMLFLGGSEDDLRGYRYKTVSPLGKHHKPLGGRSAIYTSVEGRFRLTTSLGFVAFADFGTVTSSEVPQFNAKWYKSVGFGVRYYAFFGPLRFDLGFPLDRRKHVDRFAAFYASVGQAF